MFSGKLRQAIPAGQADLGAVVEEGDLDLTPGLLDKNNDPVRLDPREIGTVPLLKRQTRWPSPSGAWSAGT